MVEAMPKLFLKEVSRAANEHVLPAYVDSFKVVAAQLGDDATVLGAAGWAREVFSSANRDRTAEKAKG
jgi:glucokinase